MKRSRNRVRMAVLLIAIVLVGGTLPSAAGASVAQQNKVTIQLWSQDPGNNYFTPFMPEFETANPSIKVEVTQFPQAQYGGQVRNAIAAGDPPDVVISNAGFSNETSVLTLGEANVIEDLSKESWAKKIPEQYKSSVSLGKKVYSAP